MQLDVWSIALGVVALLTSSLVSGFGAAIVPEYARRSARSTLRDHDRFVVDSIAASVVGAGAMAVATWLLAPTIAAGMVDEEMRDLLTPVLRILAFSAIAASLVRGMAVALLQAGHRYALASVSPTITYAAVITVALTTSGTPTRLAWGTASGWRSKPASCSRPSWPASTSSSRRLPGSAGPGADSSHRSGS